MTKTRINPSEETVRIQCTVPLSVKEWLERHGNASKEIRRLVKEARWDEEAEENPKVATTLAKIEGMLEELRK